LILGLAVCFWLALSWTFHELRCQFGAGPSFEEIFLSVTRSDRE
jgi:hypothetical protein